MLFNKKKSLGRVLVVTLTAAMLFTGCGKQNEGVAGSNSSTETNEETNIFAESAEIESVKETIETVEAESTEENTKTEVTQESETRESLEAVEYTEETSELTSEPTPESSPESTPEPTRESTPEPTPEPTPTQEIPDHVLNGEGIGNGHVGSSEGGCDHDFVDLGQYLWAPTCGLEGCGNGQCKKCGLITSVYFPPTGKHTYEQEIWSEADCAGQGSWMYTCTVCYDRIIEQDVVDPNNHVENGTCYDALGNCYGCGAHIYDVECEHEFKYDEYWDVWYCTKCEMSYSE